MPDKRTSFGFDLSVRGDSKAPITRGESASRGRYPIIVIGDFSGRSNRSVIESLDQRRLRRFDVDNLASVFAQLSATLQIECAGAEIELTFASVEDFHPDRLIDRVASLVNLMDSRKLLLNPATADKGRQTLEAILGSAAGQPAESHSQPATAAAEDDKDVFARLLGEEPRKQAAPEARGLDQFIQRVVAPHVVASPGSWQQGALAAAHLELSSRLSAILHHPDFQAVEAAWRGTDMLARRVEDTEAISLLMLDVSLAELQADLIVHERAEDCALFKLLRDYRPGLLMGNFTFGQTADDLRVLDALGRIAMDLSAPFVASASPSLVGCDSFDRHPDPDDWNARLPQQLGTLWRSLRDARHSAHIGLTAPRFMMRQPYGKAGDPIDAFPFEELSAEPAHESFLWGHSGLLVACAAIGAIQSGDSDLADFTAGEIDEMPAHVFTEGGDKTVKSYAEAWLADRAEDRLLESGIIPVMPVKHSNTIRLNHLCSVANGLVALQVTR